MHRRGTIHWCGPRDLNCIGRCEYEYAAFKPTFIQLSSPVAEVTVLAGSQLYGHCWIANTSDRRSGAPPMFRYGAKLRLTSICSRWDIISLVVTPLFRPAHRSPGCIASKDGAICQLITLPILHASFSYTASLYLIAKSLRDRVLRKKGAMWINRHQHYLAKFPADNKPPNFIVYRLNNGEPAKWGKCDAKNEPLDSYEKTSLLYVAKDGEISWREQLAPSEHPTLTGNKKPYGRGWPYCFTTLKKRHVNYADQMIEQIRRKEFSLELFGARDRERKLV